jgi:hypothetical protein
MIHSVLTPRTHRNRRRSLNKYNWPGKGGEVPNQTQIRMFRSKGRGPRERNAKRSKGGWNYELGAGAMCIREQIAQDISSVFLCGDIVALHAHTIIEGMQCPRCQRRSKAKGRKHEAIWWQAVGQRPCQEKKHRSNGDFALCGVLVGQGHWPCDPWHIGA